MRIYNDCYWNNSTAKRRRKTTTTKNEKVSHSLNTGWRVNTHSLTHTAHTRSSDRHKVSKRQLPCVFAFAIRLLLLLLLLLVCYQCIYRMRSTSISSVCANARCEAKPNICGSCCSTSRFNSKILMNLSEAKYNRIDWKHFIGLLGNNRLNSANARAFPNLHRRIVLTFRLTSDEDEKNKHWQSGNKRQTTRTTTTTTMTTTWWYLFKK